MELMSWSDETRCLHCDGKLPLYRKLTSGQFCSAGHRKAYWKEQERLAIERLHQTHDSLRAYRPPGALEAILGTGTESNRFYNDGTKMEIASAEGAAVQERVGQSTFAQPTFAQPAFAQTRSSQAEASLSPFAEEVARHASNFDMVPEPGFVSYEHPAAHLWPDFAALPVAADAEWAPMVPAIPSSEHKELVCGISMAGLVAPAAVEIAAAVPESAYGQLTAVEPVTAAVMNSPVSRMALAVAPVTPELEIAAQAIDQIAQVDVSVAEPEVTVAEPEPTVAELPAPAALELEVQPEFTLESAPTSKPISTFEESSPAIAGMLALPQIGSSDQDPALRVHSNSEALAANIPPDFARFEAKGIETAVPAEASWEAATLESRRMLELPRIAALNAPAAIRAAVDAIDAKPAASFAQIGMDVTGTALGNPAVAGLVRLPAGVEQSIARNRTPNRTAVGAQPACLAPSAGAPAFALLTDTIPAHWILAGGIRYPVPARDCEFSLARIAVVPVASESLTIELPCEAGTPVVEPSAAWLLPVPFEPEASSAEFSLQKHSVTRIDVNGPEPSIPQSRLSVARGTLEPQSKFGFLAAATRNAAGALEPKFAWTHAVDFWQHAPRDLKLLVFAIPVLLGLALHPSLPKFRVTPPANAATQAPSGLNSAMRERFENVRQTVASRAGVELTEDFRAGMDAWQSRGDLSAAWSFDSNGFVRPGMLALYQPSMNLKDYEMNFLGLIDKKALSFVVRAEDFDNYYVVKLVILKPGPLPTVGVTRYAVIDGKPQQRKDTIAPLDARSDMLYRVSVNIHDDTFLLQMQGKIVDSWSDGRLTHGGVGFFAARGEESRLRWVQVTHQYDMLGRLCAYLAPYNMPMTNGSW